MSESGTPPSDYENEDYDVDDIYDDETVANLSGIEDWEDCDDDECQCSG